MKALQNKQTLELDAYIESFLNTSAYSDTHNIVDSTLEGYDLEAFLNKWVRPRRDQLLSETDKIWVEKMSKAEDLTEINAYKQALRDLPSSLDLSEVEYVDQIEWPTKPE